MTRNETETLSKFFHTQWKYPAKKNEWTTRVREDLEQLSIEDDLQKIKEKSKYSFKKIVRRQILNEAFNHLMTKKRKT